LLHFLNSYRHFDASLSFDTSFRNSLFVISCSLLWLFLLNYILVDVEMLFLLHILMWLIVFQTQVISNIWVRAEPNTQKVDFFKAKHNFGLLCIFRFSSYIAAFVYFWFHSEYWKWIYFLKLLWDTHVTEWWVMRLVMEIFEFVFQHQWYILPKPIKNIQWHWIILFNTYAGRWIYVCKLVMSIIISGIQL